MAEYVVVKNVLLSCLYKQKRFFGAGDITHNLSCIFYSTGDLSIIVITKPEKMLIDIMLGFQTANRILNHI